MSSADAHGLPVGIPVETALPRPRPRGGPLEGRYCRLVPPDPGQAAALFAAYDRDDGRNWTYLPQDKPRDAAEMAARLALMAASTDPLFYTVLTEDGPVGTASFLRIDPANGVLEVGWISFSPLLQRSPASTEAMFLMTDHVLGALGYRRYEWKCDALNAPSRTAAERLGFTYEGTFRQAVCVKGRNRDTAWFSLLDHEWPARRRAFIDWLDPANFDAEGRQRTRLARP